MIVPSRAPFTSSILMNEDGELVLSIIVFKAPTAESGVWASIFPIMKQKKAGKYAIKYFAK